MVSWMRATHGKRGSQHVLLQSSQLHHLTGETSCRDMSVEDAIELGQRSIYHATFRDAVSGGTVSGKFQNLTYGFKFFLSGRIFHV